MKKKKKKKTPIKVQKDKKNAYPQRNKGDERRREKGSHKGCRQNIFQMVGIAR